MEIKMFFGRPPAGRTRRVTQTHRIFSKKILLAMKLTLILLTTALVHVSANGLSQEVTFSGKSVRLEKAFSAIEQQTNYVFFYNGPVLNGAKPVTIQATRMPLQLFLKELFEGQPLKYIVENNTIVVSRRLPTMSVTIAPAAPEGPEAVVPIRGIIHGLNGEPLAGATVSNKESKISVSTDVKGTFNIPADLGQTLIMTNIGYKPKTVVITTQNQRTLLYITLELSDSKLDEIQVVAYGTTTRRLSTGSVSTVTSEEIARNPVPNVLQALQGRVPGMFIQQNSGQPGGAFTVQVRAQSSLNAGPPLFIIDGVSYPAGTLPMYIAPGNLALNNLRGGNALNYLNPDIIESISVLKDAEATSIYGSRGAYGVVLITTKKGKAGAPQLNANVKTGVTVRGTSPELLNTQQYLMLRREAFKNDGIDLNTPPYNTSLYQTYILPDLAKWDTTSYTDWQKVLTGRAAVTTTANVIYSGGGGGINYLVGANYSNQGNVQRRKGSVKTGGLNFNLNSTSPNRKLYMSLSGMYNSNVNDMLPYDFSVDPNALLAPNAPSLFLPDGSLNWETGYNTAAALNLIYKNVTNNTILNTEIKYAPVKGLTIHANIGYNLLSAKELRAQPTSYYIPSSNAAASTTSLLNQYTVRTWTLDPNINYTTGLGHKGKLSVTAGGTLQDQLTYVTTVTGTNFIADAMLNNPSFGGTVTSTYNQTPNRYLGYFGLIDYNWANKYIIDFKGRYDGSTKFGPNKQFGSFGSIGGAWIVSEEPWFKRSLPFISFAKLRGSVGTAGGDNIGSYLYLNTYVNSNTQYQGRTSLVPNSPANPDLEWEKNLKSEAGALVEAFNGRISLEGVYYWTRTTNQLVAQPLPTVTGFSFLAVNSPALITTNGVEMTLNSRNVQTKNLSWTTSFNISMPHSKLVRLYAVSNGALSNINYVIGKPITGIKLYQYAGVNPQTGNYNFVKGGVTGEYGFTSTVKLDQLADRTEFVDLAPKYYGGFNNSIRYKGFSVDILFTFTNRVGKNFIDAQSYAPAYSSSNTVTAALRRWQKPGDITDIAKVSTGINTVFLQNNFVNSTAAYSSATYARLANVNVSYSLPATLLKKAHISACSIYLQGQNLLTISKFGDLDPENLGAGMAPLRVITGGINITL